MAPEASFVSALTLVAQVQTMGRLEQRFVALVDQALANPALLIAAFAAAFGVGAVHALAPGHGKAVAAAYLVGGRGRIRDAVLLGGVVAAMHTVSVVALALGLHMMLRNTAASPASAATVTPALRLVSGLMVVGLGVVLLVRQRTRGEHGHHHAEPAASPFSRRGLVVLGLAGGLLPSPSAFLVLVTAAFTGRLGTGLLLVVMFSLGLASTLTVIGIAMVRGREALVDRLDVAGRGRLLQRAALLAAAAVLAGGVVLTVAGVAAL